MAVALHVFEGEVEHVAEGVWVVGPVAVEEVADGARVEVEGEDPLLPLATAIIIDLVTDAKEDA